MKVVLTGATGMIGEGVLIQCLNDPEVTEVLSVSRRPCGKEHPKLKEYICPDFLSISEDDRKLKGYDACFFCAGVSAVGMSEEEYYRITYETTLHFARVLNPNPEMTFVYVSGGGTDSSEKGRMRWARIKGKTENDLMKLPFRNVFGFRIGFVKPADGQSHVLKYYRFVAWLFPFLRTFLPFLYNTMEEVAATMVYLTRHGDKANVIYVNDIHRISKLARSGTGIS